MCEGGASKLAAPRQNVAEGKQGSKTSGGKSGLQVAKLVL